MQIRDIAHFKSGL